jgi:cytochrome c oxidase assembly protein subunit 11
MAAGTKSEETRRRDRTVAIACLAFALGMVGAAYASVPLYRMFCQATGYGGTTQRAETAPNRVLDSVVTVRFDSNASPDVPWEFQPTEREMKVKLGEVRQTSYRVKNLSDRRVTAQATYGVTPDTAGSYFNKLECFCFTDQTLAPGETKDMPIIFFVDPAMIDAEELKDLPAITLSYTFFRAADEKPVAEAAAPADVAAPKNKL